MTLLDLVLLAIIALGVALGARGGLLPPLLGLAGALAGLAVAIAVSSVAFDALADLAPLLRAVVLLGGLALLVSIGDSVGAAVGASLRLWMRRHYLRPLDVGGGALIGFLQGILLIWLAGGIIGTGLFPGLLRDAQRSAVLRAVDRWLPSPTAVGADLLALLETTDFPRVFLGLEPLPAPPVELPADQVARALASSALGSTVLVDGAACGFELRGTGFVVAPGAVVTNAHVVAGERTTAVHLGGRTYGATVVYFDPRLDLAVLRVPGLAAPALQLANAEPSRGAIGVALGHPEGGPLAVIPAAVTADYEAVGADIYGRGSVTRPVLELRAQIAHGDSGGPLVVAPGTVGGVVFAASQTDPSVGYALPAPAVAAAVGPALGSTTAVSTGACLR